MVRYKPDEVGEFGQGVFVALQLDEQFDEFSLEKVVNRFIEDEVNLADFDGQYDNEARGAAAYNPKGLLKVILFSFAKGANSSRQMEYLLSRHISYMYLSGDKIFDYSTICLFISKNAGMIEKLFSRLLAVLNEFGLIDWDLLESDGTIASGNASKEMTGKKATFEKKLDRCERYSKKLMERKEYVEDKEKAGDFSEVFAQDEYRKIKRQEKLYTNTIAKIKNYQDQLEKDEKNDPDKREIAPDKNVNLTDKDTALLKQRDSKGFVQGFNFHCSFSNNDVLLDIEATNLHRDSGLVEERITNLDQLKKELGVTSKSAFLLDKGFFDSQKISEMIKNGYEIYIPIPDSVKWRDVIIEDGQPYIKHNGDLILGKLDKRKGEYRFRYRDDDGKAREFSIQASFIDDRDLWLKHSEKMSSQDGKFIYGKRLGKEHNHFELKELSSMRRIFRRGKLKATLEAKLHGIGHNLQKLANFLREQRTPMLVPTC